MSSNEYRSVNDLLPLFQGAPNVCVPFMAMNGPSYRPNKSPGRVLPTGNTSGN